MEKFKLFSVFMALVLGLAVTVHAATYRLGDVAYSFNKTNSTTKTANYTVTTSDSEVKVTCSSANITITLPSVSSTRPGNKAYKILKTDSTTYAVIVTPATGDTIGGESTRYLTMQNDYMVIWTGPGNDWNIAYESPLVAEDYEAGTVTVPNITVNGTQTQSGSATIAGTLTVTGAGGAVFDAQSTITIKGGDIIAEGDTADAYETTVTFADPTADVTVTVPASTSAVVVSSLTTNSPDVANSVTGASNGLVYEGATADAYETTVSATDPTADRAIVLPNGAGTVVLGNQAATQTFTVMTTTINGILRNILYY